MESLNKTMSNIKGYVFTEATYESASNSHLAYCQTDCDMAAEGMHDLFKGLEHTEHYFDKYIFDDHCFK